MLSQFHILSSSPCEIWESYGGEYRYPDSTWQNAAHFGKEGTAFRGGKKNLLRPTSERKSKTGW
jgi:hypothetical protein